MNKIDDILLRLTQRTAELVLLGPPPDDSDEEYGVALNLVAVEQDRVRDIVQQYSEELDKTKNELMVTRSKLDRVLSICARDGIEALTLAFVQSCTDERDKAIAELAEMREQRDAYAKRVCELDQRSK
jgi:hypothetical protein